jgi:outer membrane lipoprotein SlyB
MKKNPRFVPLSASLLALAMLTACVAPVPVYRSAPYPYQPAQAAPYPYPQSPYEPPQAAPYPYQQQGAYAEFGHIANIEVLRSQSPGYGTSGGGAVAGGVVGGVVGNQFGRGNGRAAATALGVIGGALLGNTIEAQNTAPQVSESYRVSVQTDSGAYRVFDVPHPGDLHIGDRVRIDNGQISRY